MAKTINQVINSLVAIIFWRECVSLTNKELQKSQYHLHISTNPKYSSLNLAIAVKLISYEFVLHT